MKNIDTAVKQIEEILNKYSKGVEWLCAESEGFKVKREEVFTHKEAIDALTHIEEEAKKEGMEYATQRYESYIKRLEKMVEVMTETLSLKKLSETIEIIAKPIESLSQQTPQEKEEPDYNKAMYDLEHKEECACDTRINQFCKIHGYHRDRKGSS